MEPQNYISGAGVVPGIDGPYGIDRYSKDLAFELYAPIPEPSSIVLIGLGSVCLLAIRRRKLL